MARATRPRRRKRLLRPRGTTFTALPVRVSEEIAQRVYRMRDEGVPVESIRAKLGITHSAMRDLLSSERREIPRTTIDPDDFPEWREQLETPLASILPESITAPLGRHGLVSVADLLGVQEPDLRKIPYIGDERLERIFAALAKLGLHRRGRGPVEQDSSTT